MWRMASSAVTTIPTIPAMHVAAPTDRKLYVNLFDGGSRPILLVNTQDARQRYRVARRPPHKANGQLHVRIVHKQLPPPPIRSAEGEAERRMPIFTPAKN
jgi:hypothetical protein